MVEHPILAWVSAGARLMGFVVLLRIGLTLWAAKKYDGPLLHWWAPAKLIHALVLLQLFLGTVEVILWDSRHIAEWSVLTTLPMVWYEYKVYRQLTQGYLPAPKGDV